VVTRAASNVDGAVMRIVTGELDPYLISTIEAVAALEDAVVDLRLVIIPGLVYDFPMDLSERLLALVNEIRHAQPPST
jgi:hypothetical protein